MRYSGTANIFAEPDVTYTRIVGLVVLYGLGWCRFGHVRQSEAYDKHGHIVYTNNTDTEWLPL